MSLYTLLNSDTGFWKTSMEIWEASMFHLSHALSPPRKFQANISFPVLLPLPLYSMLWNKKNKNTGSYILVEGISHSRNPSPHKFFFLSWYTVLLYSSGWSWTLHPPPPPHFIMHIETQGFLEIQILTLLFSTLIITINLKFHASWNSMFCFSSFSLNHHFDSRVKLDDTKTHDICKIPNI